MAVQASVSLLCLPCAGASATMYLRWRSLLPPWIKLVPVELPGRGGRLSEDFVEDFDALVAQICAEQAANMRGNFAVFGHSMGALLAYGLARRLHGLGRPLPNAVIASGSPAPSRRDAGRYAGKGDDEALIADLRKQGGTPEEVFASAELMRMTLDTLGADYRVCESFRYAGGKPLPIPLHVCAGREDDIGADRIEAWSKEAGSAFMVDWFEGGHFFIHRHEAAFLQMLARRLGQVLAGGAYAPYALA